MSRSYPFHTRNLVLESYGPTMRHILGGIAGFSELTQMQGTGNVTGMWCPDIESALHGTPVSEKLLRAFEFGVPWTQCKFLFRCPLLWVSMNFQRTPDKWVVLVTSEAVDDG